MAGLQFLQNRALVREILVERGYVHSRTLCDAIGREAFEPVLGQNVSRGFEDEIDGLLRTRLTRCSSQFFGRLHWSSPGSRFKLGT